MNKGRKEDRREFIRLSAYHLVKYKPVSGVDRPAYQIMATIKDIGAGGICLKTEEYLPVSSIIELKINFPSITTSLFALARVTWIKQRGKGRHYDVGAQFTEIEGSLRQAMARHIDAVCKKLNDNNFWKKFSFWEVLKGRKK